MKTPLELPLAPIDYISLQAQLQKLLKNEFPDTTAIRVRMCKMFQQAFQLSWVKGTRAYSTARDLKKIFPDLMDHERLHTDHYRQNLVIVTEPYGVANPAHIANLEFLGCEVWDLSQWEYHNPGHCCCIGIVLSRKAQRVIHALAD